MSNARIYEQGNGFPAPGDYCSGEGRLWAVESIDSHTRTGYPAGNWVYATVSEADWSDCPEDAEHTALVELLPVRDRNDELACEGDYRHDLEREQRDRGED